MCRSAHTSQAPRSPIARDGVLAVVGYLFTAAVVGRVAYKLLS